MSRSSPRSLVRRSIGGVVATALIAAAMSIPAATLACRADQHGPRWNENAVNVISQAATTARPRRVWARAAALGAAPGDGPGRHLRRGQRHRRRPRALSRRPLRAVDARPRRPPSRRPPTTSCTASPRRRTTAVRTRIDGMLTASLALDRRPLRPRRTASRSARCGRRDARGTRQRRPHRRRPFAPATTSASGALVAPLNANVFGQFATVTPLTLKSPDQFPTEGPPALTSAQYAAEFNEVKALGAQAGSSRTRSADAAWPGSIRPIRFSSKHRPPRHRHGRGIVDRAEQARLFAKTSLARAGRAHQLLQQQEGLERLATADGDPRSGERRQPAHLARPQLAVALRHPGLPGRAVRLQLLHGRRSGTAPGSSSAPTRCRFSLTSPGVPANCRHRQPRRCRRARPAPTRGSRTSSTTRSTAGSSTASTSARPTSTAPGSARRPPSGSTSTTSGRSTDLRR